MSFCNLIGACYHILASYTHRSWDHRVTKIATHADIVKNG